MIYIASSRCSKVFYKDAAQYYYPHISHVGWGWSKNGLTIDLQGVSHYALPPLFLKLRRHWVKCEEHNTVWTKYRVRSRLMLPQKQAFLPMKHDYFFLPPPTSGSLKYPLNPDSWSSLFSSSRILEGISSCQGIKKKHRKITLCGWIFAPWKGSKILWVTSSHSIFH